MNISIRELALQIATLSRRVDALSRTTPQLGRSSIEDGAIHEYEDGNLVAIIGRQDDGSHGVVVVDGPDPLRTTQPVVEGRAFAIAARWDGNFIDPETGVVDASLEAYKDTKHIEAHIGDDVSFVPSHETMAGYFAGTEGGEIILPSHAGTKYVKFVTRALSGKTSVPSAAAEAEVSHLVDPEQFEDLEEVLNEASEWIAESGATLETLLGGENVIPEAVIDHLWTNVVRARQITTDMLLVGSGPNLIPNGALVGDVSEFFTDPSGWTVVEDDGRQAIRFTGSSSRETHIFPLEPGEYKFSVEARAGTLGTRFYAQLEHSGSDSNPYMISDQVVDGAFIIGGDGMAWKTFTGTVTVPDDFGSEARLVIYPNHSNGVQGSWQEMRGFRLTSMTDASLIVEGSIAAQHVNAQSVAAALGEFVTVKANNIEAGVINAAIEMGTNGRFVATDTAGFQTIMSGSGIEHWGEVGEPDNPTPQRISKFGRDLQFVTDDGIKGINEQGDGTVRALSVDQDPLIAGSMLMGTLALRNAEVDIDTELGHLDYVSFAGNHASWTWPASGWAFTTTTEKTLGEVMREQQAGRAVLVLVSGKIRFADQTLIHRGTLRVRKTQLNLPTTSNPSRPTTSSALFGKTPLEVQPNAHGVFTMVAGVHVPSRSEKARWLITFAGVSGGWRPESLELTFIDLGPMSEVSLDSVDRVEPDSAPTPPVVTPKKTYTSRWYANTIRRWQRPHETPAGDRSGQALQGWTNGMSGDPFDSILGFTGTAHFGETGRTLTAALGSGATIDRVRIRITQAAGYSNVQPRVGIQSSSTATPVVNQTLPAMSPGQTRYTTLTASAFKTGLASGMRYITFGPGSKQNASYAAYHGTSGGNSARVELEVTYTR